MKTKCSVSNERHTSLADTFPLFPMHIFFLPHICSEENTVNMAAPYSGYHNCLTLFTMYGSVRFLSRGVEEKATVHHEW